MTVFSQNTDKIKALCERYHVRTLFAFGSAAEDNLKPSSDVDMVVDIDNNDPILYTDDYFGLKFQLEQLFKRQVDLLEKRALKNQYLVLAIEKTQVLVYGKGN